MAKFFSVSRIRAENGSAVGRVDIYGEISAVEFWGDEKTPSQFITDLNALGKVSEIEVHIFSPGGDPFAALAILAELNRRPETVSVYIDGIAASAATLVLCAGDTVFMDETSMLMVHNPYQLIFLEGLNAKDARELADDLDKIREPMITAYMKKSGKTEAEVIALMDGETGSGTWLTASESIAFGLADAYTPEAKKPLEAAAKIAPAIYNFKGHRIDLSKFDKAAEKTASIINTKMGGNPMGIFNRKPKPAAKIVVPKAEITFVEMVCPSCGKPVNLNPDTGEVFAGGEQQAQPKEGQAAAPAPAPVAASLAIKIPSNIGASLFNIKCPHCGEGFVWDTEVNADGDEGQDIAPAVPLGTGAAAPAAPASGEPAAPAAPAPAPAPAVAARVPPNRVIAARIPVAGMPAKPKAELAQAICPACNAQVQYDTMTAETGDDGAGTEGYLLTCPGCGTQFIEPFAAPASTSIPVGVSAQAAYQMGVRAERSRMLALDKLLAASPASKDMILAAKKSGASAEAMSQNVITTLSQNPAGNGAAQYLAALGKDLLASGVNNMRTPQHAAAPKSVKESAYDQRIAEYNKQRGVTTNA